MEEKPSFLWFLWQTLASAGTVVLTIMFSIPDTSVSNETHGDPVIAGEKEVTAEILAKRYGDTLRTLDYLEVEADYQVAFLTFPLEGEGKAEFTGEVDAFIVIEQARKLLPVDAVLREVKVGARSQMHLNHFESVFWREDWKDDNGEPIILSNLRLEPAVSPEGLPTLHEWHRYPLQGGVTREHSYSADERNPQGFSAGLKLPDPLFPGIPGGDCLTADLGFIWLGDESSQTRAFERLISAGKLVGTERFNGREAYRVEQLVYRDEDDEEFDSLLNIFWLDLDSGLFLGWCQKRSTVHYGRAAGFRVTTISYRYPSLTPNNKENN